ncbi:MAG: hypothetical protein JXJ04_03000 [Spirochaetales bacterium]|nr:hypothetical protein [Spirochaetales bacterium]
MPEEERLSHTHRKQISGNLTIFHEGLTAAMNNYQKIGYVNKTGDFVITLQ